MESECNSVEIAYQGVVSCMRNKRQKIESSFHQPRPRKEHFVFESVAESSEGGFLC